jgi:hypothetical protein
MQNTAPYIQKIKTISLNNGVVLTDAEAYEILARLIPLVKVVYQPTLKMRYGRRTGWNQSSNPK